MPPTVESSIKGYDNDGEGEPPKVKKERIARDE
jgi:hypothetical protein